MQRWKCCSSWSKQNPKLFSNTGFPQGKPVFFSAYIFLAPEWPEEKVGKHTVCPSCGGPCMKEGQSREAELIEWRSAQKRSDMSGLFCPEIFGILITMETICTVCTEGGIR